MGIESVFKSMAGADWNSSGLDGLSAAEFGAFLKEQAGADGKFNKKEFKAAGEQLGLSGDDSKSIMEAFGKDGQISVDKLQSLLEDAAGSDKAFNLDELKGGLENLADRAEKKNDKADKAKTEAEDPAADFARDAGADEAIDENEFKAMCENAGIDEETAKKAFDKAAGADGKISQDEFKEAFGGEKADKGKFKDAVKDLAGEKDPFAKFGRDAGADKAMSKEEFSALAEKAGIDEETAGKAFDKIAGADGEISKEEFSAEGGLGDTKLSKEDFKSKVEELAGSDESSGADESDAPSEDDGPSSSDPSNWSHSVEDGKATINLGDKYTITAEENGEQFTIKNNETGHETKVSGDPHVDVGNDGQNDFDFKKDMTFELDDGTKVTVGTIDAGNGTTFSSELTITNGDNAIKVTGLAGGADGENNLKVVQSTEGEAWDEEAEDGFTIDEAGSGWTAPNGDVVDQDVINKAEA